MPKQGLDIQFFTSMEKWVSCLILMYGEERSGGGTKPTAPIDNTVTFTNADSLSELQAFGSSITAGGSLWNFPGYSIEVLEETGIANLFDSTAITG